MPVDVEPTQNQTSAVSKLHKTKMLERRRQRWNWPPTHEGTGPDAPRGGPYEPLPQPSQRFGHSHKGSQAGPTADSGGLGVAPTPRPDEAVGQEGGDEGRSRADLLGLVDLPQWLVREVDGGSSRAHFFGFSNDPHWWSQLVNYEETRELRTGLPSRAPLWMV